MLWKIQSRGSDASRQNLASAGRWQQPAFKAPPRRQDT